MTVTSEGRKPTKGQESAAVPHFRFLPVRKVRTRWRWTCSQLFGVVFCLSLRSSALLLPPLFFYNNGKKKTKWRRPLRDRASGSCAPDEGWGAAVDPKLFCSHFVFVLICSRLDRKIKTGLPSSSCCGAVWSKSQKYSTWNGKLASK